MDVFEIVGEPAIVINGVPNLSPSSVTPVLMNKENASEANKDPGFGEWLEGREVKRMFEDEFYSGKVVRYDSRSEWYRVAYENGDLEDVEWHELKEALLPLDFSTSLVTLASQRCKSMQSYSEYSLLKGKTKRRHRKSIESTEMTIALLEAPPPIGKTKRRHRKSIESTEMTIALLEAPPPIESRDSKLVEAKHSSQAAPPPIESRDSKLVEAKHSSQAAPPPIESRDSKLAEAKHSSQRVRQIRTRSRTAASQLAKPELSIIPYLGENTAGAGGIAKRTRRGKGTGAVRKCTTT